MGREGLSLRNLGSEADTVPDERGKKEG